MHDNHHVLNNRTRGSIVILLVVKVKERERGVQKAFKSVTGRSTVVKAGGGSEMKRVNAITVL